MSHNRRDADYLRDILEAMARISSYTAGMSFEGFMDDPRTQDAVVRNLEVIGEATKRLSGELRKKYRTIPWKDMAGVRDKLIHHYFGIEYKIVWSIASVDLPKLTDELKDILAKEAIQLHLTDSVND
ncbi:HepT-like ribonuclease domain-containing protein [Geotalea uraniireducens]|uniref:DUF86 domain-containing protein n=1 Tax=Geotalea uraniireducens (strain Rf4) TaxID=351605 RepID=A5G941_GEOUR|nr:DUF86 domain-containing protein [Geotalea uraniireducens]ABQ28309.1 protein of unknown function DUF86 [Geotalea uraniireducens Rf4]